MELVLEADDLVAELRLALLPRDELKRPQQVLAGAQRHAAAGRVDDRSHRCARYMTLYNESRTDAGRVRVLLVGVTLRLVLDVLFGGDSAENLQF